MSAQDIYVTATPFGMVNAIFEADGAGVKLEGSPDAVAHVARCISAATDHRGMSVTLDSVEPATYVHFCAPEGSGMVIVPPADFGLDDELDNADDDAESVQSRMDAVGDVPGLRGQLAGAAGALAKLALAKAMRAARQEEPAGISREDAAAVAKTILQQLGGNKFKVMTGAKDFFALNEGAGAPMGGLRFSLPTGFSQLNGKSTGINRVFIRLNASDTYDIEFGGARGKTYDVRQKVEDIYADSLREVFTRYTGLDTSMGSAFGARPKLTIAEASEIYDQLGWAVNDLQGYTDMELARQGSTDTISERVEVARRAEADWPTLKGAPPTPRNLIERAEALIDRAQEMRREGGIVEIGRGDALRFFLRDSGLTQEQIDAILDKPSRVTRSGSIDVPRYVVKELQAAIAAALAGTARPGGGASGRFAYALVYRPADIGTIPKGVAYEVQPRPAPGQPHHEMARHGILVTERELTVQEQKAFELAPLIAGEKYDWLADKIAASIGEYAKEYVALNTEDPEAFWSRIRQAVKDPEVSGGVMFSIASEEALVDRVLSRLEELAAATPEPIPPSVSDQDWARQTMLNRDHLPWADVERAKKILGIVEPTAEEMMKEAQEELARRNAAAAATGQRSADMALLTQVAAGQHPQMLEPELADLIEAALERHPDDAEVQTEGERAITAYSNGLLSATGG